MNSSLLINIIIILGLIILFYYFFQKQQKTYNKEIKNVKLQNIESLETSNDIHIKHLNKTIEQLEAATEEQLKRQEQKYQAYLNEKDKYINNIYKISMSQGEILTFQLLKEIKQQFIAENLIYQPEMIIMNNIFIPSIENGQTSVRQIDHLVILPVGLIIIETKPLKNTIIHGLTKENLDDKGALFEVLFSNENPDVEQTFMIETEKNVHNLHHEIKIISQVSPVIEIKKTTEILTRYLMNKTTFNQSIQPIVYFNNSNSDKNKLINYSKLTEVPLLTDSNDVIHYFKERLKNEDPVIEIEKMYEIKSIIEDFNNGNYFN